MLLMFKEKMGSFIDENLNTVICGNAYELIKNIPDKSIDLIYVDLPYQFASAGGGGAFGIRNRKYNLEIAFEKEKQLYEETTGEYEKEKHRKECNRLVKKKNLVGIDTGIDYSIYDEFCRVEKEIYIYLYGYLKHRFHIQLIISAIRKIVTSIY